jgi:hypothetical protein
MLPWFRDDGENLERWPSCASDTGAPGPKQLKEMLAKYSTEIPTTIVACFLKLDVAGMREVIASMSTAHLVSTSPTNRPTPKPIERTRCHWSSAEQEIRRLVGASLPVTRLRYSGQFSRQPISSSTQPSGTEGSRDPKESSDIQYSERDMVYAVDECIGVPTRRGCTKDVCPYDLGPEPWARGVDAVLTLWIILPSACRRVWRPVQSLL